MSSAPGISGGAASADAPARYFAIVNPTAGHGRCGKLAPAALSQLRESGLQLEVAQTARPGEATALARAAYARGFRNFLAVGGDGTSHEVVNGLFPEALALGRPVLGFLPLGTGNSFLRDFTSRGVQHTMEALHNARRRSSDLIRIRHAGPDIYFLNVLSLGFPADVGELTNRRFKRWGELGYVLAVFARLAWLHHAAFPYRLDGAREWDRRPCLFLAFTNSKFTGGRMMIAPNADPSDGRIECVRWAPIGRLRILWLFPRLFSGSHINHPLAFRAATDRIELDLPHPVNAVVDGEILQLQRCSLEILPGVLDIVV